MKLSADSLDAVVALFERASGIRYNAEKRTLIASRLTRLATESGAADLDEYVDALLEQRDPAEIARVVDRLTINETYFFREPAHFELLAQWADIHDRSRPFRVWSAACSTGEEAWSAAMVLADVLGDSPWEVVGTDLSTAVVQQARTGLYAMSRIDGIGQERLRRHCLKGHGPHAGQLLIARALRERVSFRNGNLLSPPADLGAFDVVFLRNVLIYFDAERKREIVGRVLRHLRKGGLLFVGHAETLTGVTYDVAAVQPAVYEWAG